MGGQRERTADLVQVQYFGTTGVDPYGNPAGDGWSNLQKFQNGWNPNTFYTPAAPQGLTVSYNANTGTATVNWLPSPGAVTGYVLTTPSGTVTLSASTTSYADHDPTLAAGLVWKFSKLRSSKWLNLEARVGIERSLHRLPASIP